MSTLFRHRPAEKETGHRHRWPYVLLAAVVAVAVVGFLLGVAHGAPAVADLPKAYEAPLPQEKPSEKIEATNPHHRVPGGTLLCVSSELAEYLLGAEGAGQLLTAFNDVNTYDIQCGVHHDIVLTLDYCVPGPPIVLAPQPIRICHYWVAGHYDENEYFVIAPFSGWTAVIYPPADQRDTRAAPRGGSAISLFLWFERPTAPQQDSRTHRLRARRVRC